MVVAVTILTVVFTAIMPLFSNARQTWEVGKAAFWGRLFGTLGKVLVSSVMVAVVVVGLVI